MELQNEVIDVVLRLCKRASKSHLGPMFTMVLCLRISFPKAKKLSVESWNNFTLKIVTQWKKTTKKLSFKAVMIAPGTWVKQFSAVKEMHSFNLLI